MAEAHPPLSPEDITNVDDGYDEFRGDYGELLVITDTAERAEWLEKMQEAAVISPYYYEGAKVYAREVEVNDAMSDSRKARILGHTRAVFDPTQLPRHFGAATPEELPSLARAERTLLHQTSLEGKRQNQAEAAVVDQRLKIVEDRLKESQAMLKENPDLRSHAGFMKEFDNRREAVDNVRAQLGLIDNRLERAVEAVNVAREANPDQPSILPKNVQAREKALADAIAARDKAAAREELAGERLRRLQLTDDEGMIASMMLAQQGNRRVRERYDGDGTSFTTGHIEVEQGRVEDLNTAIGGLAHNIIRTRYEAEHGQLSEVITRARGALADHKFRGASEHSAHVASTELVQYLQELNRRLDELHPDPTRRKPANWTAHERLQQEAQAEQLGVLFVAKQHLREQAGTADNFEGHAPVIRTTDGGMMFTTEFGKKMVVYADRSYRLDDGAGSLGDRRRADGSEWEDGAVTERSGNELAELRTYLEGNAMAATPREGETSHDRRTRLAVMQERVNVAHEKWLFNQDDPRFGKEAVGPIRAFRQELVTEARKGTYPAPVASALRTQANRLRYVELQMTDSGTYDDDGRGSITVREPRGSDTYDVTYWADGHTNIRRAA